QKGISMLPRMYRFLAVSLFAAIAIAAANFAILRRTQAEQEQRYGHFNARQIIERTEPICRALEPPGSRLRFLTERGAGQQQDGVEQRTWHVECQDETGRHLALFVWNADTGNLLSLGHNTPPPPESSRPYRLNHREIVQAARQWMEVLGITARSSGWRM